MYGKHCKHGKDNPKQTERAQLDRDLASRVRRALTGALPALNRRPTGVQSIKPSPGKATAHQDLAAELGVYIWMSETAFRRHGLNFMDWYCGGKG